MVIKKNFLRSQRRRDDRRLRSFSGGPARRCRVSRNPHLASAQVNGRVALSVLRSLAGEGFRLGPNLRDFSGIAVRFGGAVRFRDSVSPNGMELPLSLARRLSTMRHIVGAQVVDNVAHR